MADWFLKVKKDFITCFLEKDRWHYILQGLGNTLKIALVAVLLGVVIGTVVAIIRSTYDKNAATMRPGIIRFLLGLGNAICRIYLTVIRGTPVMIQILIMFFVIFSNARDGVPVAMLTFGINSGAYVAEIIRGGIMAVDAGQMEAGRSLHVVHRHPPGSQERAPGPRQRVHRPFERDLRRLLRGRQRPHQGRRDHPLHYLHPGHAAAHRGGAVSRHGDVLQFPRHPAGKEAARQ